MQANTMAIRMYKVAEVARMVNVTPHAVLRWIHTGKVSALKLPAGGYRIPENEVNRIMTNVT